LGRAMVVLVDDDRDFLDEISSLIAAAGYDAAAFCDGAAASEAIRLLRPDIVILDLKMPRKNGMQIARQLLDDPVTAGIPVIAVSAFYAEPRHRRLMEINGIRYCLRKPFGVQELMLTMGDALSRNKSHRAETGREKDESAGCDHVLQV
jgi:DNA-binding response OmpR family regulator